MPRYYCDECHRNQVNAAEEYCDDCVESILRYLEADEERRIYTQYAQELDYQKQFELFD